MYNYQNYYGNTQKNKRQGPSTVELLDLFDEGVARDKLRKIELRKDAMMLLRVKQKYDIISQHFSKFKANNANTLLPYIKLNNGQYLLMQSPE